MKQLERDMYAKQEELDPVHEGTTQDDAELGNQEQQLDKDSGKAVSIGEGRDNTRKTVSSKKRKKGSSTDSSKKKPRSSKSKVCLHCTCYVRRGNRIACVNGI